ncbi:hypothetical protein CP973_35645 [Streptomyces albofaciens JCM 4342]|uniref:hypothetical protein n=1 Tax=Streptomyces albofaciens TaxID=66866 RepID=UPI00123B029F|nr:hypothetical protein [Streptomyces albofaciens]KAA6214432.1 hypothetical protein CP973_35645 [Streptomyces albofaciens JCM 4342]
MAPFRSPVRPWRAPRGRVSVAGSRNAATAAGSTTIGRAAEVDTEGAKELPRLVGACAMTIANTLPPVLLKIHTDSTR